MPGLLSRRSMSRTSGTHGEALNLALAEKDDADVRQSKSMLPTGLTSKSSADSAQIISIVDDPENEAGLSSFLPKSLTCLNKFA